MNIDMKYIQVVVGLLLCYCLYTFSPRRSLYSLQTGYWYIRNIQDVTIPYNVKKTLRFPYCGMKGVDAVCVSVKGSIGQINAREQGDIPLESLACICLKRKEHAGSNCCTCPYRRPRWLSLPLHGR